jgi:ribonuclease P protein component
MKVKASFRPHERLKDPKDFRRAFDRRRSESDSVLVIYGVENSLAHSRLGISVARKKVRAASSRNRLKRLVREAFRLSKAELPSGIDLVVIPRTQNSSALSIRNSLVELGWRIARRLGGSHSKDERCRVS